MQLGILRFSLHLVTMDSKLIIFIFHLTVFAVYVFALIYDTYYLAESPSKQQYAGRFKYLTFWNEVRTVYK